MDVTLEEPDRGDTKGKRVGRAWSSRVLSDWDTLPSSPCIRQRGGSLNLIIWGCYGGFITQARLITSWAIAVVKPPAPLGSQDMGDGVVPEIPAPY